MAAITLFDKEHFNTTRAPGSQQGATIAIGGGHPATAQVLPQASGDNRAVLATASATGDTPVFQAYKHN